jgi:hypothetical protein
MLREKVASSIHVAHGEADKIAIALEIPNLSSSILELQLRAQSCYGCAEFMDIRLLSMFGFIYRKMNEANPSQ